MSDPVTPGEKLARQGSEAEIEQQVRLMDGADPVYAHVATFATASALVNIHWISRKPRRRPPRLEARLMGYEGPSAFPAADWSKHVRSSRPTGEGVALTSSIGINHSTGGLARTLPADIDSALVAKKTQHGLFLQSSTVSLRRSSPIYGVKTMEVGIEATHTADGNHARSLRPINKTANPAAFEGLLDIISESAEESYDGMSERERSVRVMGSEQAVVVTSQPDAHFRFHEELGVPAAILEMARQNYGVIIDHMGLHYPLESD